MMSTRSNILLFIVSLGAFFIAPTAFAEQDIGLRVSVAGVSECVAIEDTISSPLRIAKGGTVYSMVLVEPNASGALKYLIKTAGGVKAFKRCVTPPLTKIMDYSCYINLYGHVSNPRWAVPIIFEPNPPLAGQNIAITWYSPWSSYNGGFTLAIDGARRCYTHNGAQHTCVVANLNRGTHIATVFGSGWWGSGTMTCTGSVNFEVQ